jgi:hypothetical protein
MLQENDAEHGKIKQNFKMIQFIEKIIFVTKIGIQTYTNKQVD